MHHHEIVKIERAALGRGERQEPVPGPQEGTPMLERFRRLRLNSAAKIIEQGDHRPEQPALRERRAYPLTAIGGKRCCSSSQRTDLHPVHKATFNKEG